MRRHDKAFFSGVAQELLDKLGDNTDTATAIKQMMALRETWRLKPASTPVLDGIDLVIEELCLRLQKEHSEEDV